MEFPQKQKRFLLLKNRISPAFFTRRPAPMEEVPVGDITVHCYWRKRRKQRTTAGAFSPSSLLLRAPVFLAFRRRPKQGNLITKAASERATPLRLHKLLSQLSCLRRLHPQDKRRAKREAPLYTPHRAPLRRRRRPLSPLERASRRARRSSRRRRASSPAARCASTVINRRGRSSRASARRRGRSGP